jgi:hypothetical protein
MPSRSGDHRPVTAAGLASPDFMSRNLRLPYHLRLHRTLRHRHNLQFLHNRPAPKSAADLQQNLASWLFRSPGRRSRPGVILPLASAAVTARIAAETSLTLSIGGKVNLTVRSRHGGKSRSMQSRMAVGSPASASSTALRVNASDSPASNAAAASVALLREPGRRPAGLPDRPFSNGRPRARPAVFVTAHQT